MRALIEHAIEGMVVFDSALRPLFANPAAGEIFGDGPDGLLQRQTVIELIAELEHENFIALWNMHRDGVSASHEIQGAGANGSAVWLEGRFTEITWGSGSATLWTMLDVTQRRQTEQALAGREQYYRQLVEHSQDAITVLDRDYVIRYVSPAGFATLGYAPDELVGRSCFEFVHPDLVAVCRAALDAAAADPDLPLKGRYRLLAKNGDWIGVDSVGTFITGADGEPRVILSSRDITERVEAELTNARFMAALDHSPISLTLWDKDDRLLYFNRSQYSLYNDVADALEPGVSMEFFLRLLVSEGMLPEASGRAEDFVAERLRQHRGGRPSGSFEQQFGDHWLKCYKERLPDGSTLLAAVDISDQIYGEHALRETKAQLQAILDNTRALVYLKDLDGRYILVNPRAQEISGDTLVLGKTDHELTTKDLADARVANDRKVLGSAAAAEYEEEVRLPEGGIRTYISTKFPLKDDHGKIVSIGGISSDITQLKQAEQALRDGEEKFRMLVDGSIQGLFVHQDEKVVYANQAMADMHGYSMDELLGLDIWKLISPDETKRMARYRELRTANREAPNRYEYRGLKRDGTVIYVEQMVRNIDWEGRPAFQNTLMDVTERKHAEALMQQMTEALRAEKERAEDDNSAKSAFLAAMSHELRTPLNAIIGFSDIMRQQLLGPLQSKYHEYSNDICNSAEHLRDIINDILDLSKVEAGRMELVERPVDLAPLVASSETFVAASAREKGVALIVTVPDDLPPLLIDERAVKQILINLLSNAVKFTARNGEVRISVRQVDGGVTVEVRDTGVGIPAEELEHVFEPFRQGRRGQDRPEGTGLGLALVKSLADLHGAEVLIDSSPGAGTSVRVRFSPGRTLRDETEHRSAGA